MTATPSATPSSVDPSGAALIGVDPASSQDGTEIQPPAQAETPVPVAEPAAAPEPPASPAEPSPESQATPANQAEQAAQVDQAEAPTQLAYTGWDSWLIVIGGVGLIAGGVALIQESSARRRRPIPVPERVSPPVPNYLDPDRPS
jgi:uncharacterized membrane protein